MTLFCIGLQKCMFLTAECKAQSVLRKLHCEHKVKTRQISALGWLCGSTGVLDLMLDADVSLATMQSLALAPASPPRPAADRHHPPQEGPPLAAPPLACPSLPLKAPFKGCHQTPLLKRLPSQEPPSKSQWSCHSHHTFLTSRLRAVPLASPRCPLPPADCLSVHPAMLRCLLDHRLFHTVHLPAPGLCLRAPPVKALHHSHLSAQAHRLRCLPALVYPQCLSLPEECL